MQCQVTFMTLSYFAVMLMFDTFKRNKVLKTDLPMCLLPSLECLNGRMDETFWFLLSERKGEKLNYVGCQVLRQTTRQYFCKANCNKFI